MIDHRKRFISILLEMNYGTLKGIAEELTAMAADKKGEIKLKTSEEFACLLYDWAESQE